MLLHHANDVYHVYLVMMFPVSKIIDKKLCYPSTGSTTDYLLSVSINKSVFNSKDLHENIWLLKLKIRKLLTYSK